MTRWSFRAITRSPTGGHHFPVGPGFTLRGESVAELAKKLAEHRTVNGLAPGDPLQEIARFYAQHFPWMVEAAGELTEQPAQGWDPAAYVRREWTAGSAFRLAQAPETVSRRAVCAKCPFNQPVPWKLDLAEHKEAKKRLFLLRRGQPVPDGLGYCTHHGWDNGLATMKAQPGAATGPAGCWLAARLG